MSIEATLDGGKRIVSGIAIPFNRDSLDLGGFIEQFAPSSVDRTIRTGVDVRALAHHDAGRLLGRLSARTLRIDKSGLGLEYVIALPDTGDGRDVFELVKRRDLTGASFEFRIVGDGEQWDLTGRIPRRIVTDTTIREISLVSWPAYPSSSAEIAQRRTPTTGNTRISLLQKQVALWRATT